MRPTLLACLVCLLCAACGPRYEWVKPGVTAATKENDLTTCDSKAEHATRESKDAVEALRLMDRCMAERGYEKKQK